MQSVAKISQFLLCVLAANVPLDTVARVIERRG